MPFTSVLFVLFLTIVVVLNYLIPVSNRWILLLLTSILFYAYLDVVYIPVIFSVIIVTWYAGRLLENSSEDKKSVTLGAAITGLVLILLFFKYGPRFSLQNSPVHFSSQDDSAGLLAPLGLSYIMLQAIGYLIEIRNGNHVSEKHLGYLSAFFLFFPKVIAGPVERAHHFLPVLRKRPSFRYEDISQGLKLIVWGLFKKLVVANRLAIYTGTIFDDVDQHSGVTLLVAVVFYLFQLYADLSGYTDMARGFARLLGFNLAINFKFLFLSKSLTQFWKRWHISLSGWFIDYIYTPLVATRQKGVFITGALSITFIAYGFWHQASNLFLLFGAIHGILLSIEHLIRLGFKGPSNKAMKFIGQLCGPLYTFTIIAFSLIFFKAVNFDQAITIIRKIALLNGPFFQDQLSLTLFSLLGIGFLLMVEIKRGNFSNRANLSSSKYWLVRNCLYFFLLVAILIAGVFDGPGFIYAKF